MFPFMKDVPFAEWLSPLMLAAVLWIGAHVLVIGPHVIAPRLAHRIYLPQCRAAVTLAVQRADQKRLVDSAARDRAAQIKQEQAAGALSVLLRGMLGREFVEHYKDHPALQGIGQMTKLGLPGANSVNVRALRNPSAAAEAQDYCACQVAEAFSNALAIGLHSASLRLWKPEALQRLARADQALAHASQCRLPEALKEPAQ